MSDPTPSVRSLPSGIAAPVAADPVDAYLERFEGVARAALEELRELLRDAVPGATETMAYGIPTLDLDGDHVIHFAGFARHVGLYPTPSGMAAFDAELARYVRGKGSVRFALDEPLPTDLIRRIAAFRVAQVAGTAVPTREAKPRSARRDRQSMPDSVRHALETAGLMEAYRARPPYQRNDYLAWIAGAKREATRTRRLRRMLDELAQGGTYMGSRWGPGSR